jgi:hypothetical protein
MRVRCFAAFAHGWPRRNNGVPKAGRPVGRKSDLLSLTLLLLPQSNLISRLALFLAGGGRSLGIPYLRAKMTGASRLDKFVAM